MPHPPPPHPHLQHEKKIRIFRSPPSPPPSSTTRPTLYSTQVRPTALDVRGGASLGPITPGIAIYINLVGCAGYAAEMMLTTKAALAKYWGTQGIGQEAALISWFGWAIAEQTVLIAILLCLGVDAVLLCKASAVCWIMSGVKYAMDYSNGLIKDNSALFTIPVVAAVLAYCGYA